MGNVPMAREIWGYVEHPLHCALLASHQCKEMSKHISWGQEEANRHATDPAPHAEGRARLSEGWVPVRARDR